VNTWINLSALWKIIVIGLAAGAGLPAVFALGLRALNPSSASEAPAEARGSASSGISLSGGTVIAGLCFAAVLAGVGWGIYSIVHGS
jgi:hypothetical protein